MIKAVIFDLDGLMLDTERIAEPAWRGAMSKFGFDISDNDFQKMIGITPKDASILLTGIFGESFIYDDIRELALEYYYKSIAKNGIPHKDGLINLLDYLDKMNIPKAIATSTVREFADHKLTIAQIKHRFEHITCGDDVDNGKPSPDIFLKAAKKINMKPDDCLVLEDSRNGIIAAHAAGMKAVMIPDTLAPCEITKKLAHKILPSLNDVIELLSA